MRHIMLPVVLLMYLLKYKSLAFYLFFKIIIHFVLPSFFTKSAYQ